MVALRFANDEDALRLEPHLDVHWPRLDATGARLRTWDVEHALAMSEIDRRLRSALSQPERFDIGLVGLRSQESLRECAASFAVHFIFLHADSDADVTGFFARKASYWWKRAEALFDAERLQIDYDVDRSGVVDVGEQNRPIVTRFLRG